MKTSFFYTKAVLGFGSAISLWVSVTAWGGELVDLSVGAAMPSNNGAILENPSALPFFQDKVFDLSARWSGGGVPDFAGSYSAGTGGFGYGLELQRTAGEFLFAGAFATRSGNFAAGINVVTSLSSISPSFDLGIKHETQKLSLAFVLRDIAQFGRSWVFAIASDYQKMFRFGLHLDLISGSAPLVGITDATVNGIVEVYSNQKFSLRASYGLGIVPTLNTSRPGLGLAANVWVLKNTSIYGEYLDYATSYTSIIGMKFILK